MDQGPQKNDKDFYYTKTDVQRVGENKGMWRVYSRDSAVESFKMKGFVYKSDNARELWAVSQLHSFDSRYGLVTPFSHKGKRLTGLRQDSYL